MLDFIPQGIPVHQIVIGVLLVLLIAGVLLVLVAVALNNEFKDPGEF